jgi:hypothetical protein
LNACEPPSHETGSDQQNAGDMLANFQSAARRSLLFQGGNFDTLLADQRQRLPDEAVNVATNAANAS